MYNQANVYFEINKQVALLSLTYKAIQWVPIDLYSSRFITYLLYNKLFIEQTPQI